MALVFPRASQSPTDLTDKPDTLPPKWWPTHPSRREEDVNDLMVPGWGEPADGKNSKFYYYQDAVFSDAISMRTREWLHACHTSVEKVRGMIEGGIDIHTANANGFTGLHMAAQKFKLEIAELLVENGHDVNIEDANGETPLDACFDNGALGEGGNKPYEATLAFLESQGGYRKAELCWLNAYNQAQFAPNDLPPSVPLPHRGSLDSLGSLPF